MIQSYIQFNHEKLEVYQSSIQFISWLSNIMEAVNGNINIIDHNRFLEIAIGSVLECAAYLDVMFAKQIISTAKVQEGKVFLIKIVRMLYKLSSSISAIKQP